MDAFFFPSGDDTPLFGVWRGSCSAKRTWVICPPFAEEEKSARRTLTVIAQRLEARGEASLLFSYRGTGDSTGEFANASLLQWREDIRAAIAQAHQRTPEAEVVLLGVRLGASLALLEAEHANELRLIEPITSGRSYVMQLGTLKKIRAQLTNEEAAGATVEAPLPDDDLDGWPLTDTLKSDLRTIDLKTPPKFAGKAHVYQVSPRAEVAPPLQAFASSLGAEAHAVVMPAFWNLLDYSDPKTLLEALEL